MIRPATIKSKKPCRTGHASISGWCDFEDLYESQVLAAQPGARFCEVGCWLGRSLVCLGQAARRHGKLKQIELHAVDTFRGSPDEPAHRLVKNVKAKFLANIRRAKLPVTVHATESVKAAATFPDNHFDFVFLDAAHDEASVRADIRAWLPKVKPGGLLAGHDFTPLFPGVVKAVTELLPGFEMISRSCWTYRRQCAFDIRMSSLPRPIPSPAKPATLAMLRRHASILIATPSYLGQTGIGMADSVLQLTQELDRLGIHWVKRQPNGEMVARARNRLVADFMESECTHLLFIDWDISFRPSDVVDMLQTNVHVIGGVYPKKMINWERVRRAALNGTPASELHEAGLEYVFNPLPSPVSGLKSPVSFSANSFRGAVEVAEIGTGFLLIHRSAIARMIRAYPHLAYRDDYSQTNGRHTYALFDYGIEHARYLSEDFRFCARWRAIGGKVFAWPWARLTHAGFYIFPGNFGKRLSAIVRTTQPKPQQAQPTPLAPPQRSKQPCH